jgi:hypothetical protein
MAPAEAIIISKNNVHQSTKTFIIIQMTQLMIETPKEEIKDFSSIDDKNIVDVIRNSYGRSA